VEGPSLVILAQELKPFTGKRIQGVGGNTKLEKERLNNKTIRNILSWGKHLIIVFDKFSVRIHFLMFGSYRINERKPGRKARLCLKFKDGEINFYTCSVKFIEEDITTAYDWKVDTMADTWDEGYVLKKVKEQKDEQAGDALLNQDIFAGVGNIIKCEVLFNVRIHPETQIKNLTAQEIKDMTAEARAYCWEFYGWKRIYTLRKHWKVYKKKTCPVCGGEITLKKTGKTNRRSFICEKCQVKK
jgi:endonuclease-8